MDASSIRYKGYKSPTLHLVYLCFIVGTVLLLGQYIDMHVWKTEVLGLISAYIIASGFSKGAEAYANRNVTPTTPTFVEQPGSIVQNP